MIYQELLVDLTNTVIAGRKLVFTSTNKGQILVDSPLLGNTISKTITSSLDGQVTASLFNNSNYSVTLEKPTPETKWYVNSSGSFTGSVELTGSLTKTYFDTQNIFKQDLSGSKIVITPVASYPRHFSGSLVALCSTQSFTNAVGEMTLDVIPGIYKLTLKAGSEADDSNGYFYVSGHEQNITASNYMLLSAKKGTPFKLGEGGYVVNAPTASYALTASFALNASGNAPSSSWASSSLSASYAQNAANAQSAINADYSLNATLAQTALQSDSASWASSSLSALNALHTGSDSQTVDDGWNIDNGQLTLDVTGKFVNIVGNIQLTNGKLFGSASFATSSLSSSHAITSSFSQRATTASYASTATQAANAQTADTATNALTATSATFALSADSASLAQLAKTASLTLGSASYASQSAFNGLGFNSADWKPYQDEFGAEVGFQNTDTGKTIKFHFDGKVIADSFEGTSSWASKAVNSDTASAFVGNYLSVGTDVVPRNEMNPRGFRFYEETNFLTASIIFQPDDAVIEIYHNNNSTPVFRTHPNNEVHINTAGFPFGGANNLYVGGNISASAVTASTFLGTASVAVSSSRALTASISNVAIQAVTSTNAENLIGSADVNGGTLGFNGGASTITDNSNYFSISPEGGGGPFYIGVIGNLTGFHGTASWAVSSSLTTLASTANTASFVTSSNIIGAITNARSASFASSSLSASYLTASYAVIGLAGTASNPTTTTLELVSNSTDYTNTNGAGTFLTMKNRNQFAQNVLASYVGNTMVAKWRTDYAGNVNWIAGAGYHTFYTAGDYPTGTPKMTITNAGDVVIDVNNTSPSAKLHVVKTSEQFRVGYNTSNYLSTIIDASGNALFNNTGTNASCSFAKSVSFKSGATGSLVGTASWANACVGGLTATRSYIDGDFNAHEVHINNGIITFWSIGA